MSTNKPVPATIVLVLTLAVALANALPGVAAEPDDRTEKASATHDGKDADGASSATSTPAMSGDGRIVAFESEASNLVPGDGNERTDVFVRDLDAGTITRVSLTAWGAEADDDSGSPAISRDGRIVTFASNTRLTADADPAGSQIYAYDRSATQPEDRLELVSRAADGDAREPTVSADGRYVAFTSSASVFVYDRLTGETTEGPGAAEAPSISDDGRYVAFSSDVDGTVHVHVHDLQTSAAELVSVDDHGDAGDDGATAPSISGDGRFVAFASTSSNLVPYATNGDAMGQGGTVQDVYVHDRQTRRTERVSVTSTAAESVLPAGAPSISGDGRFVAFEGTDPALAPGPANPTDIYVHDRHTRRTERASLTGDASVADASSARPTISADGGHVAFVSEATNLAGGSSNGLPDVYVRNRGPALGTLTPPIVDSDGDAITVTGEVSFAGGFIVNRNAWPFPNLELGLDTKLHGGSVAYRPEDDTLVFTVRLEELSRRTPFHAGGVPGVVYGIELQVDGVPYEVRSQTAPGPDPLGGTMAVMRCDVACRPLTVVSHGEFGFGTTGQEIVMPVPLELFEAEPGSRLGFVRAYGGVGDLTGLVVFEFDAEALGGGPIPELAVTVGLGPPDADPDDVEFDTPATLTGPVFAATLDRAAHPGEHGTAYVQVCAEATCTVTSAPVDNP